MFSILQWNIKGYWNNFHELQLLLQTHTPSFISLQETHIQHANTPTAPAGYVGYFHNFSCNLTCKQGLGVLVKSTIPHTRLSIASRISTIAIELNIGFKVTCISMYIPPSQNFQAHDILSVFSNISSPTILLGDFNSWSTLWGSTTDNHRGKIIEDVILASNLVVLNNGLPTHFSTHKTFTSVDLTMCSAILAPKCSWKVLSDLHGSDHFPIITTVWTKSNNSILKKRTKFLTRRADWNNFRTCCENVFSKYQLSENVNKEASNVGKILREASHLSIPQSKAIPTKHPVPWWNSSIALLRNNKQKAWAEYKKKQTVSNLIAYKKANAAFRYHCRAAKRACFEQFTSSINPNSNPRKIWHNIKLLTGTFSQSKISVINTERGSLLEPNEIANHFSSTWSAYSNDPNFDQLFIYEKRRTLNNVYSAPTPLSTSAKQIEEPIRSLELNEVLQSLNGKTPGQDRISYDIIKNAPTCVKNRLLKLYNDIFSSGIYPQKWKNADIVPILKPNQPQDDIKSYRPISLLSCLSKVLEKIIAKRLMWFVLKEKLISPNQSAFKTGQGTADALLHFEHYLSSALSSRNHATVLGLDFVKAFDRIGVHVVLRQLQKWKIGEKVFYFVKSLLTNRTFRIKLNNTYSDRVSLYNGIAQGSPISVTFFIIAFDEITNILVKYNVEFSIYADDVFIYSKNNSIDTVKQIFSNILNEISNWALSSGANIAYNKCNILHICKKKNCNNISFRYNNYTIDCVPCTKILGIIFDKSLSSKAHCTYLKQKLTKRLNIVKYLASKHSNVHPTSLINVTKSLILSVIDYGLSIYGQCSKKAFAGIQQLYHSAARKSLRAFPTTPVKNLLAEAGLPELKDRVHQNTLRLIPKLYVSNNIILNSDIKKAIKRNTELRRPSTICKVIKYAGKIDPFLKPTLCVAPQFPPWKLPENTFIANLLDHAKCNTSSLIYRKLFYEIHSEWLELCIHRRIQKQPEHLICGGE